MKNRGRNYRQQDDTSHAGGKGELANAILPPALDDIAWAKNLRTAGDIVLPIFVAYLMLTTTAESYLLTKEKILSVEADTHLSRYGIDVMPHDLYWILAATLPKEKRLLIDPEKTSRSLYDSLSCTPCVRGGVMSPNSKASKRHHDRKHKDRDAQKDGVALTRFFMMAEREYPKENSRKWSR